MDDVVTYVSQQERTSSIKGSRRIRLVVYPIQEGGKWPDKNYALDITSDGGRSTIGMSVKVEKSLYSIPSASTVTLYNLAESTREMLTLRGLKAEIFVADPYVENFQKVFIGTIMSCISQRSGTEIVTTLRMLTGVILLGTTVMVSPFVRSTLRDLLESLKKQLGLKKLIICGGNQIGDRFVERFFHMGTPLEMLNKLAFQESLSWNIEEDDLIIIPDNTTTGNVVEITPETGLISAVPMLSGPWFAQNGVAIKAYPIPWLSVGDRVIVKSHINSKTVNRSDLSATTMTFNLSTIENSWDMDIQCFIFNPAIYPQA